MGCCGSLGCQSEQSQIRAIISAVQGRPGPDPALVSDRNYVFSFNWNELEAPAQSGDSSRQDVVQEPPRVVDVWTPHPLPRAVVSKFR